MEIRNRPPVVTVSQVNRVVSMLIKGDRRLASVSVRGEISNFTRHYKTGHLYFTLKDEQTQLKAVMFAGNASELSFEPENGALVVCHGAITVYEPSGVYQINCSFMEQDGAGEQAAALEELKKRLLGEGLFSQHRPIPQFPKKIAVVTSAGGAALQDVINIISRRYPVATLVIVPAQVQGATAPQSVAAALERAQDTGADTIIFGRGGGSSEDLAAFNTEIVARAVYNSAIPTISAVGHETDFTIADMAADMRAPTPSAAAELAVPDASVLLAALTGTEQALKSRIRRCIADYENDLNYRSELVKALSPQNKIASAQQRLESLSQRISGSIHAKLENAERSIEKSAELISALNPMGVLVRGYSVTYHGGRVVTDAAALRTGDDIEVRLSKGRISAKVEKTEKE
ncbi:MAG: exodeoxyribonuclease VII large subunit [Oscillospiraceae bacterium]|nr:exodeoxyribonuclease VII large subunit [Oscillospiraceae bacterium]